MKVFMDTEFTGLHQRTTLISIGLVDENNSALYIILNDYNESQVNDWVQKNVIKNLEIDINHLASHHLDLDLNMYYDCSQEKCAEILTQWLYESDIEIWSDCLAYDWVLFRELFNNVLPENINTVPRDLSTYFAIMNLDPDISRSVFSEINGTKHNALDDAIMTKACHEKLTALYNRETRYVKDIEVW